MRSILIATAFTGLATAGFAAEWSFTDGAGKTITLPQPPTRILAHTNAVAGLAAFGIKPAGAFIDGPLENERPLADIDMSGIEIISTTWDAIDVEVVLEFDPDLIITEYWAPTGAYGGSVGVDGVRERVESIAPILGVLQDESVIPLIESYGSLAESLGADLSDPAIVQDRADFDAAVTAFQAALADKPGLKVMAISPFESGFSIAITEDAAELVDFAGWGMDFVTPADTSADYWFEVSWENAADYPADLIIVDDRWGDVTMGFFENPLAQRMPAIASGQLTWWPAFWIRSYRAYADQLTSLTAAIVAADPTIVD